MHSRSLSIFAKLTALNGVLIVAAVGAVTSYLSRQQQADLTVALEAKAATYSALVSKQVESAIAFDDRETAREVFDSVSQDREISAIALFTSAGQVLRERGEMSPEGSAAKDGVSEPKLLRLSDRVIAFAPVRSLEGPTGSLAIELSTKALAVHQAEVKRQALLIGAVALLLGIIGAGLIAHSFARRLRAIAEAATAVASGDLDRPPAQDRSRDEIGQLSDGFNRMVEQLRELFAKIQNAAKEEQQRLERLVAERTAALDQRNTEMRLVFDNVGQGFIVVDAAGTMSSERSAVLDVWLGKPAPQATLPEWLAATDPTVAAYLQLGLADVFSDILPVEVVLDQLPKKLKADDRTFAFEYRTINGSGGACERVLVIVSDVTAELARQRAEIEEREISKLFSKLMSDRGGLLEFMTEATRLVEATLASDADLTILKRNLHTLKGNAALFGVESLARTAHELEDVLLESGSLSGQHRRALAESWERVTEKLHAIAGDLNGTRLEIEQTAFEDLRRAVAARLPHERIAAQLDAWMFEPAETRLLRIAEQAKALAQRLGKGPLEVVVDSGRLHLDPKRWASFWSSLQHVVRNALDHGLEPATLREAEGKPATGRLLLRAAVEQGELRVEVRDDGKGINWDRLRERARERGLPAETKDDLVEALFADGVSTKDEVTEISGRGVGLAAVRSTCQSMGGRVEVESAEGRGTAFTFRWPARPSLVPAA